MEFRETAIVAAQEAGKVVADLTQGEITYCMKNRHDILAEADLASEQVVIERIKATFPDHRILSEEQGDDGKQSEYLWIIDPVDGTINLSRGIDEYCVSVAVDHEGKLQVGVLFNPARNLLFTGEREKGAFLNGDAISVSEVGEAINMLLATDNSSKEKARRCNYDILARICNDFRHIRIMGSGALHLARLASGEVDVYYKTRFNYWDYAAGVLLVQEAGGTVTDFAGNPISRKSKDIVASNGKIHDEILQLLNG